MGKTLLSAVDVKVSFGLRKVLDIDRLEIRDGERIGLVGENGAGKTTLLSVLAGSRAPDQGQVKGFAQVSVIRQDRRDSPGEADLALRSRFRAPEAGENLSGGEETRRRIAAALSQGARVLLADEPTSDLDPEGVQLLTDMLKKYDGALLLVSHDRALLDDVVHCVWELADGKITVYPGNYSAYRQELLNRRSFERFEYEQYRSEQTRLRQSAQRMVERASQVALPSRMGNSEARLHKRAVSASQSTHHQARKALETRLDKLEEKRRPREDPDVRMEINSAGIVSRVAVEARNLTLMAGPKKLLTNADFRVPTYSRTALVGPNGCGKTTLIRAILAGAGVTVSPGVRVGTLDQDMKTLEDDKSALENAMRRSVQPESAVRTMLARLGIRGDAALKSVAKMSGGERVKVRLTGLMASDVNLLILDEPTNHLDVFSLEALGDVLSGYGGTLLFVSHDRRFVEQVATRLIFCESGALESFEGTMAEWRARKERMNAPSPDRMILEMRMAELAARLSKPKKGDNPEDLNRQYLELAEQLRAIPRS
jgi:macrolide transport system ATP-binding/permease protein